MFLMLPYVVKWVLVVQSLSHVQLLWPHGLRHTRSPCPLPSLWVFPSSCPLNQWWHPTNSSSVALFSCLQSFPALRSFPMSWFLHQLAKVLQFQLRHHSFQRVFMVDFQDWLVWSPWFLRVSEESSPAPQLESISSSLLSPIYGTTLTSVQDFWKDHNLDRMNLCQQNYVFALKYTV